MRKPINLIARWELPSNSHATRKNRIYLRWNNYQGRCTGEQPKARTWGKTRTGTTNGTQPGKEGNSQPHRGRGDVTFHNFTTNVNSWSLKATGIVFNGQIKQKCSFSATNSQGRFGVKRTIPIPKIICMQVCYVMLWDYFSSKGPGFGFMASWTPWNTRKCKIWIWIPLPGN